MSRGPKPDHPASRGADSPSIAFESLLATALHVLETEGEGGIARLCAQHESSADRLRRELQRLRAAGLVGTLPVTDEAPPRVPLRQVGPYELVRRLGAGGMGDVWLARQREPLVREVALKVVPWLPKDAERARFAFERQVLSSMQHDGIARVFEAGETEDGVPWFAMEYVRGRSLTVHCDERRLSIDERVELLARVCDAVQHAHQHGVIHRDLKPDNILVTEQDGRALPKVIDFGLARALARAADASGLTRSHAVLGTLAYMSPEQALAPLAVDVRTDVYALGAILFELLTGRVPLVVEGADWLTFLRRLGDEEPPRPTTVAQQASTDVARARGCENGHALARLLATDLDWIVLRALGKRPSDRYASVAELARDLRRFLVHAPVSARPPSRTYQARKFVRRHRIALALGASACTVAITVVARELTNLAELRRRDARYDRLALGPALERLVDAADGRAGKVASILQPGDGRRHDVAVLDGWLAGAADLARARDAAKRASAATEAATIADPREQVLARALADLDGGIDRLQRETVARVERRRAWAWDVAKVTLEEARAAWAEATAAIADSPIYRGLVLQPQLGLVPWRAQPETGLWEFRFWLPGGEAPRLGDDGRLANAAAADPVFVLLPGGTFAMGSDDRDPWAAGVEKPRHDVELAPFFIGKYEVTRGQWRRMTGSLPESVAVQQQRHAIDDAHPVGEVSWWDGVRESWEYGLRLPTEAQWEYAARAGTSTPWWTGAEPESLSGRVNIADADTLAGGVPAPWAHVELRDGYAMTAPVDALAPNAFGLHHVLGNVWEWTSGHYTGTYAEIGDHRPGDGFLRGSDVHPDNPRGDRVARGGSYLSTWVLARCPARIVRARESKNPESGLRLARFVVEKE